jgi:diguanylate cyclase (GGDEF)-like protein
MILLAPTTRQALRRTATLTAVSVVGSLALFLLAMQIFQGVDSDVRIRIVDFWRFGLAISILAPMIVCPLVCYRSSKLIENLRLSRDAFAALSQTDQLTGLLNRRGFDAAALASLEACRLDRRPVAVLMCDIDHFKRLNDNLGHTLGDKALVQVGDLLRGFVGECGLIAGRQGGDEFVAMLPGMGLAEAASTAENIRVACSRLKFDHPAMGANLSVSIGVAASAQAEASLSSLLRRADVALYEVKRTGRNRIVAADIGERWSSAA